MPCLARSRVLLVLRQSPSPGRARPRSSRPGSSRSCPSRGRCGGRGARSNASIIARGGAAPPTVMNADRERSHSPGFASSACRIPIQIVGTPAVTVTFCSTKRVEQALRDRGAGRGRPASTPTSVHENGKHHAFAWNIGTTGRHTSSACDRRGTPSTRQRVDRDRAVRVEDALRLPGGAARVTHRRGGALVDVAVRERRLVARREQLLVVDRAVGRRAVADRDHVLEADAVDELLGERPEHLVDDEHAVAARAWRCT